MKIKTHMLTAEELKHQLERRPPANQTPAVPTSCLQGQLYSTLTCFQLKEATSCQNCLVRCSNHLMFQLWRGERKGLLVALMSFIQNENKYACPFMLKWLS